MAIRERTEETRHGVDVLRKHGIEVSLSIWRVLVPVAWSGNPSGMHQPMVTIDGKAQDLFRPCLLDQPHRDHLMYPLARVGKTGANQVFMDGFTYLPFGGRSV